MSMRAMVLIPSRMAATRLPNKPLADIHGEPMIVHVWRRAVEAAIGPVHVACAEPEIASRLWLEVTESERLAPVGRVLDLIGRLRQSGVRLALDDLGAGHMSLAVLRDIDADVIKIDGTLIKGLACSQRAQMIVKTIVELAHRLGAHTVAEWIETNEDLAVAKELGADFGQGYLFGRPTPAACPLIWRT